MSVRDHTLSMSEGGGAEGFCGGHEIFLALLMGHENFFKILDGP